MPRGAKKPVESDGEADEYVVDKILAEADNGKWYQVSWKGYDDITWEPRRNLAQTAALDVWLAAKKKKSKSPERRRKAGEVSASVDREDKPAKRRRGAASSGSASARAGSETSFVASEDDGKAKPEVATRKSSRPITAASTAASPRRAGSAGKQDGNESAGSADNIAASLTKPSPRSTKPPGSPASPSKRSVTASPRGRNRSVVVRQSSNEEDEAERVDDNARPEQFEVLEKYRALDGWDGRIARIETVERYEDESALRYYVQWKGDADKEETCWIDDAELHAKAPQAVITFLTSHLRWGGR